MLYHRIWWNRVCKNTIYGIYLQSHFWFNGNKILTTSGGGMVLSNNKIAIEKDGTLKDSASRRYLRLCLGRRGQRAYPVSAALRPNENRQCPNIIASQSSPWAKTYAAIHLGCAAASFSYLGSNVDEGTAKMAAALCTMRDGGRSRNASHQPEPLGAEIGQSRRRNWTPMSA